MTRCVAGSVLRGVQRWCADFRDARRYAPVNVARRHDPARRSSEAVPGYDRQHWRCDRAGPETRDVVEPARREAAYAGPPLESIVTRTCPLVRHTLPALSGMIGQTGCVNRFRRSAQCAGAPATEHSATSGHRVPGSRRADQRARHAATPARSRQSPAPLRPAALHRRGWPGHPDPARAAPGGRVCHWWSVAAYPSARRRWAPCIPAGGQAGVRAVPRPRSARHKRRPPGGGWRFRPGCPPGQ